MVPRYFRRGAGEKPSARGVMAPTHRQAASVRAARETDAALTLFCAIGRCDGDLDELTARRDAEARALRRALGSARSAREVLER